MKPAAVCSLLAVLLSHGAARADVPAATHDATKAGALFYEARTLMGQGRYAEACPKLEESLSLDAGTGTTFNLADCNEHLGKIASAWAGFVVAADQSRAAGKSAREMAARYRAQALALRVPKLVVEVPQPAPGLEVRRDGAVLPPGSWGTPTPVDPGSHTLLATAPGRPTWESTVHAAEGKTASVTIPPTLAASAAPAEPEPARAPAAAEATTTETTAATFPEPVDERRGDGQRTLGLVIGGVGLAGLLVGGVFGLRSLGDRDDARDHCRGDACDPTGFDLRQSAIRSGNVATVATVAGGVALLGGALLILTSPSGGVRAGLRAGPVVGSGGGLFVGGTLP